MLVHNLPQKENNDHRRGRVYLGEMGATLATTNRSGHFVSLLGGLLVSHLTERRKPNNQDP